MHTNFLIDFRRITACFLRPFRAAKSTRLRAISQKVSLRVYVIFKCQEIFSGILRNDTLKRFVTLILEAHQQENTRYAQLA